MYYVVYGQMSNVYTTYIILYAEQKKKNRKKGTLTAADHRMRVIVELRSCFNNI